MPRILFIAAHRPDRSPSQRFRFEQYFEFLNKNGFECRIAYLISERTDKVFYMHKSIIRKAILFINLFLRRLIHVLVSSGFDIIFIQREAWMTGSVFFEKQLKRSGAKLVFDFDDAIWKHDVSDANKHLAFLKRPDKTEKIIQICDQVIAGNSYLEEYAKQFNNKVEIIPTTIDTDKYLSLQNKNKETQICIGWSGSITTIKHFDYIVSVFERLKTKYGTRICFKVIGDRNYKNTALDINGKAWNFDTEINDLQEFDIGIMPLPDDEWTRGKCGLKGLQFMALGIATVMSPVGVNKEIIEDGINGFLAGDTNEWFAKLSILIEDENLRHQLGAAGRETIVKKYSVTSQQDVYLKLFNSIIK